MTELGVGQESFRFQVGTAKSEVHPVATARGTAYRGEAKHPAESDLFHVNSREA